MESSELEEPLPSYVRHPLRFRERGREFEGEVGHPKDLVRLFEPIDVVNGATELVDQNGLVITVLTADPRVAEDNEYPKGYKGLSYHVQASGNVGRTER
jgi:hypothetical protein